MRVAVVGTADADSKLVAERLDRLLRKLTKPTVLFVPPAKFLEGWCFARLLSYEVFHEGVEAMVESADALVAFGAGWQRSKAVRLAEKRGIKIKRVQ